MRFTIHILGLEVVNVELSTDDETTDIKAYGDVVSALTADPDVDAYVDKARAGFNARLPRP